MNSGFVLYLYILIHVCVCVWKSVTFSLKITVMLLYPVASRPIFTVNPLAPELFFFYFSTSCI